MDILLAWVASVVTGLEAIVIKMASKSLVRSPWLFNVLWLSFAVPPMVVLAMTQGGGLPRSWSPILLTSLCSAGFYVLYTLAVYKLDVTTMTPLFSIRTITSVLLGFVLLGESLPVLGIILILLIVGASPLASFDEKQRLKAFLQRHVFLAITAMVFLALVGYFTNRSVDTNGYATTVLWQDLLTLILLLPTLRFVNLEKESFTKKSLVAFGFLGLASFIYTTTTTYAYAHKLSLSSIIVSLPFSMIFAWLLSFRYPELLEKHPPRVYAVRFTGAAVMVGGAIWLSLL